MGDELINSIINLASSGQVVTLCNHLAAFWCDYCELWSGWGVWFRTCKILWSQNPDFIPTCKAFNLVIKFNFNTISRTGYTLWHLGLLKSGIFILLLYWLAILLNRNLKGSVFVKNCYRSNSSLPCWIKIFVTVQLPLIWISNITQRTNRVSHNALLGFSEVFSAHKSARFFDRMFPGNPVNNSIVVHSLNIPYSRFKTLCYPIAED